MAKARKTLLDFAQDELRKSEATKDPLESLVLRRQAAEKAWGHLVEITDKNLGVPKAMGPQAHDYRRQRLDELDRKFGSNLLVLHNHIMTELHGSCFYEASPISCDATSVRDGIKKTTEFLTELDRIRRKKP